MMRSTGKLSRFVMLGGVVGALAQGVFLPHAGAEPTAESGAAEAAEGQAAASGEQELSEAELAKKTQNPVADLISVPFQNNLAVGTGTGDQLSNVLNVQPVIPFHAGPVNIITRTILPIVYIPSGMTGASDGQFGLGDMNITAFVSPAASGSIIWGVGPVLYFPTATDDTLGTDSFGAGPSAVALTIQGPWVVGVLANHVWSFAGFSDRRDVNQTLIQYFVNYNLPHGWYLVSAPILTGNWEIPVGDKWTVPFGAGVGRVFRLGKLPINANVQGYYNVVRPNKQFGGSNATIRFQLQFVLPKSIFG